ncbi:MAG: DUF2341 domain-containing protein [Planctomycetota bacterium]
MKHLALLIIVAVVVDFVSLATSQAAPDVNSRAVLTVTHGLVCWYDAAVGITTDAKGVVQTWKDLSGNEHFGTLAAGSPMLASNQIHSKPAVQFRTSSGACGFKLDGPFFVEQQFVVVRSPNATWNRDGCFLGRRWARNSSYRLGGKSTAFWGDQYPNAVSKNGKKLGDRPFDLAPITDYMILKIDVNDGDMSKNTYQIGMADLASCDFDVAEILGYQTKLSSSDEELVGGYLAAKYGISTAYPAGAGLASASTPTNSPTSAQTSTSAAMNKPDGAAVSSPSPTLPVKNGLACWYDAAVCVTADAKGAIQTWSDLSGNAHHGTPGSGTPVLVLNQINLKPIVQFRNNWLALGGTFFAKEHYLVVRSPSTQWSGACGLLGRLKGRGSSYNTWGKDTGFWTDQPPVAVSRNGAVLPGPAFDCSPLTKYMVLKIVVNDGNTSAASYAIGNNDGLSAGSFDVAEILGYQSMLSPADEALVGAYLAAKYGIDTAYPPLPPTGLKSATLAPGETAAVKYRGWQHSGSLVLLTTPEGANLPATASEENFPVLVRLNKDWFNFSEAKANGEDIRFATSTGTPLAYQIDEWDAAAGTASIWVRVPTIEGNARQEIKMYWGKADAKSESSGSAVFNRSNGYLSVWHMNDQVKDDAGTVASTDMGTTSASGMIGRARHFAGPKGINCGEKITAYPFASSPHTSEAWINAEKFNTTILNWGKGDGVNMRATSTPAHISINNHAGSIHATSVLRKSEWVQVVHTYNGQGGQIYINGRLDIPAATPATMQILTPVRMQIGVGFFGDLDEVRISKVARSADWVKLQYENQKTLQTLVGPLVQSGKEFSVSEKSITLLEGKSTTVTARAGGAQKVYWIIKNGGSELLWPVSDRATPPTEGLPVNRKPSVRHFGGFGSTSSNIDSETIATVDRFSYTIGGRVTGDQSFTLQFKAVFSDGVKTLDIPVTIKEDIPDPVFTLKAPAKWDGRETIEVVPQIANLKAMEAKNAGELKYDWTVPPTVEIKEIEPGKLILKRARNSGKLIVTVAVSNGGKAVSQSVQIAVNEPLKDAWVDRVSGMDEKPVNNQFYARDDKNEGTLVYNGTLPSPPAPLGAVAESVFLKVYADDKHIKTESQKPKADKSYAFSVKLKPGLIKYKVEFGTKSGNRKTVLNRVTNLVCGDAYLINGQSNALAVDWGPGEHTDTSEWIRSFGDNSGDINSGWGNAVRRQGGHWQIGCWGMDLARLLVESEKIPICIMNGAVGGTLIEKHQRNPENPLDRTSIYGRLLNRIEQARLIHGIRGAFWHQGECDQTNWGEAGGYGWETYEQYFLDMTAAWKQDFPNIQHYYVFQIWPNSCSIGGNRHSDKLRDVQRLLPRHFSNMSIMSTLGIKPEGGCHFPPAGYAELARQLLPVVEQYNYGKVPGKIVTAPDLKNAYYTNSKRDEITLEFDQPMVWNDSLKSEFYLDGEKEGIVESTVSGSMVRLKLAATATAKTITYLVDRKWDSKNLLYGQNGIAALTFFEVPISPVKPDP